MSPQMTERQLPKCVQLLPNDTVDRDLVGVQVIKQCFQDFSSGFKAAPRWSRSSNELHFPSTSDRCSWILQISFSNCPINGLR